MKTFVAIAALSLAGCAAPNMTYRSTSLAADQQPLHKALPECSYEAAKASAAVDNPFTKAITARTLERQCMSMRGYVR